MILFNTAYGLAKKNRPFTYFPTVCSIQEKNGPVGLLCEIYITDKAAKHITSSIAKTLRKTTAADLHKARFVSVMSDGSTDTTIVEQEMVYVRYVDYGNPVTKLASIQALEHGNAEGVHQGVMKGLATMELTADKLQPVDPSFTTLVCANFNGASVMMGSKSGVATRKPNSSISCQGDQFYWCLFFNILQVRQVCLPLAAPSSLVFYIACLTAACWFQYMFASSLTSCGSMSRDCNNSISGSTTIPHSEGGS